MSFPGFRTACRGWLARFGLTDWSVEIVKTTAPDNYADVAYNCDARSATIGYSSGADVRRIALHEVLHLALADTLAITAHRGSDTHEDVRREEHRLIERLIAVIEGPA